MSNELDYTAYDFDTLVSQLTDRLKASDAWKDTTESAVGQMLIELLAYVGNQSLYYIERRAEESYIDTAQNRSSVINLTKLLNYRVKRTTSSIGILSFYLDATHAQNITIPKWTSCQTSGGVKFVTLESVVIIAGQTEVEANAVQGELATDSNTSDGSVDQEYVVGDTVTNVEDSADSNNPTLIVTVDEIPWTEVTSFLSSTPTSLHYRVVYNLDDTVSIKFGNNIKGKVPITGATILIQYVKSDGVSGNVYQESTITTINDTIVDALAVAVSDINVTNLDRIDGEDSRLFLGGDAAEDTEEIRYEAPRVFATGDRAVTKEDFIAILENTSGVANANVWGELEEAAADGLTVDVEMLNLVRISMLLQEWELPDDTFKTTVSTALRAKSMIAVKYEFIDPDIIYVLPRLTVVAVKGTSLSDLQDLIETTLEAQFTLGTTTKIGTDIYYSNLVRSIDELDDVAYHNMIIEIRKVLSDSYNSDNDYGAILNADPIKTESIEVYVGTALVGTDDGVGGFTALDSDYYIEATSSIDYTTGEILLDFATDPGSSAVFVLYEQADAITTDIANGNIVTEFNEIAKLYDVDFDSITVQT